MAQARRVTRKGFQAEGMEQQVQRLLQDVLSKKANVADVEGERGAWEEMSQIYGTRQVMPSSLGLALSDMGAPGGFEQRRGTI